MFFAIFLKLYSRCAISSSNIHCIIFELLKRQEYGLTISNKNWFSSKFTVSKFIFSCLRRILEVKLYNRVMKLKFIADSVAIPIQGEKSREEYDNEIKQKARRHFINTLCEKICHIVYLGNVNIFPKNIYHNCWRPSVIIRFG